MDLVFELPAKGLPRHRRGQAEQDAAVELKRTEEAGFSLGGTDGSNPSPSSEESAANLNEGIR